MTKIEDFKKNYLYRRMTQRDGEKEVVTLNYIDQFPCHCRGKKPGHHKIKGNCCLTIENGMVWFRNPGTRKKPWSNHYGLSVSEEEFRKIYKEATEELTLPPNEYFSKFYRKDIEKSPQ